MQSVRSSSSAILFSLVLVFASVLPAAAQQSDADAPAFGEIVDVRVINLEVVVTDGRERVSHLASDDFRLLVDGEEVPIEYFTEVQGGYAVSAAGETGGEPAELATLPALRPGRAVGTRYLVFIDEVFTIPPHRNRVLRHLAEQLPVLGPEDYMAVVAFNGGGIDMLTSWTSSIPKLERVFEEAQSRKAFGLYNTNQRLDAVDRYYLRGGSGLANSLYDDSRFRRDLVAPRGSRTSQQVDRVVDAATSVLRGFAKPEGRKVMLLLSGGWPVGDWDAFSGSDYRVTTANYAAGTGYGYGAYGPDRQLYAPLVDTANRLGYTLYPVDVKGLESSFGGAEFGTLGEATLAANLQREREWIEEGALAHIAKETGGRALLDGASYKALERAAEDTRSYYWVGFTPTWQENDERHRVKVEVKRKGLKVRARKNFTDLSRQTEVTMLVESSQLFGHPMPGEKADLTVTLGEPTEGGFRKIVLPVKLEIPFDQITLLPGRDGYSGHLELRVAATDDRGDSADIPVIPVEIASEQAAAPGEDFVYQVDLKLRKRPHRLLISVHDTTSGAIFSKKVDFSI